MCVATCKDVSLLPGPAESCGSLLEVSMENDTYLEYLASDSSDVLNDSYQQLCFGICLS